MDIQVPDITTYLVTNSNDEPTEINLPNPYSVSYWRARAQRTFYIDYEIDSQQGTDKELLLLTKTIIEMNVEEKDIPEEELKPITIYIQTLGGELDVSFNLADVISASRIPIITVGMGSVMSAGFIIFLAGKRRYIFKHSNLLIHSGSATLSGTAEQVAAAQANYNKQLDEMKQYTLERTDIPEKVFNKNRTKEWYLTIDEVEEYGVATVISSIEEIQ